MNQSTRHVCCKPDVKLWMESSDPRVDAKLSIASKFDQSFLRKSLLALIGISSDVYFISKDTPADEVDTDDKLFKIGYSDGATMSFFHEIKKFFLIHKFLQNYCLCQPETSIAQSSSSSSLSSSVNILRVLIHQYNVAMMSFLSTIDYNHTLDLVGVLSGTAFLRQFLVQLFLAVASTELCELFHSSQAHNCNKFPSYQTDGSHNHQHSHLSSHAFTDTLISILNSKSQAKTLYVKESQFRPWQLFQFYTKITGQYQSLCQQIDHSVYSFGSLQFSELAPEAANVILSTYFLKHVSYAPLAALSSSLFVLQPDATPHQPFEAAVNQTRDLHVLHSLLLTAESLEESFYQNTSTSNSKNKQDVSINEVDGEWNDGEATNSSSGGSSNCVGLLYQYHEWVNQRLRLFFSPEHRQESRSTLYHYSVSDVTNRLHSASFSLSPSMEKLCVDISIHIRLPLTRSDVQYLLDTTESIQLKLDRVRSFCCSVIHDDQNPIVTFNQQPIHSLEPTQDKKFLIVAQSIVSKSTNATESFKFSASQATIATTKSNSTRAEIYRITTSPIVTSITGVQRVVDPQTYSLAKSHILAKYSVMMQEAERKERHLVWAQKRQSLLTSNRRALGLLRDSEREAWVSELANKLRMSEGINAPSDEKCVSESKEVKDISINTSTPAIPAAHTDVPTQVSSTTNLEAQAVVRMNPSVPTALPGDTVVPSAGQFSPRVHPQSGDYQSVHVSQPPGGKSTFALVYDTVQDSHKSDSRQSDSNESEIVAHPPSVSYTLSLENWSSVVQSAEPVSFRTAVDAAGAMTSRSEHAMSVRVTQAPGGRSTLSLAHESASNNTAETDNIGRSLTSRRHPTGNETDNKAALVTSTEYQPMQEHQPGESPNVTTSAIVDSSSNQQPESISVFSKAAADLLNSSTRTESLLTEWNHLALSQASITQSLLSLSKEESLTDIDTTWNTIRDKSIIGTNSVCNTDLHSFGMFEELSAISDSSSPATDRTDSESGSLCFDGSSLRYTSASFDQPVDALTKLSLLPLVRAQANLFDRSLLASVIDPTNGRLLDHLSFLNDTCLFSPRSIFLKQWVRDTMDAHMNQNRVLRALLSDTTTPTSAILKYQMSSQTLLWSDDAVTRSFIQTSKASVNLNSRKQDFNFYANLRFHLSSYLNQLSQVSSDDEITLHSSQYTLDLLPVQALQVTYQAPWPISMFISKPLLSVIARITGRLTQILQLDYTVSLIWQKIREKRVNLQRKNRQMNPKRGAQQNSKFTSRNQLSKSTAETTQSSVSIQEDSDAKERRQQEIHWKRSQNYSFLLVQQTVRALLNFIWDRVYTYQADWNSHLTSVCVDNGTVSGMIQAIHSHYTDLLFGMFVPGSNEDSFTVLKQIYSFIEPKKSGSQDEDIKYRLQITNALSRSLTEIIELCHKMLLCLIDNVVSGAPTFTASDNSQSQTETHAESTAVSTDNLAVLSEKLTQSIRQMLETCADMNERYVFGHKDREALASFFDILVHSSSSSA